MMILQFSVLFVVVLLLALLVRALDAVYNRLPESIPAPVGLFINQIEGDAMADMLTYEIVVAAPTDRDVVAREVIVGVDGQYNEPVLHPGTAVNLGQITVPQNSAVLVSVTDVDDAGNRSEPATLAFNAVDVARPALPGGVSVVFVGENVQAPETAPAEPTDEVAEEAADNVDEGNG